MFDPCDEHFLMSRRIMMMGGMALGAAGALGMPGQANAAEGAAAGTPPLAREGRLPTDPAARNAMYRRVRMRLDSGMYFWFFRGRNYLQQGATLTPVCELNYGAFMRVTTHDDGSLTLRSYELGMRAALGKGPRSEQLYNPYTDRMVDLPFAPVGPVDVVYDAQNNLKSVGDLGGTTITVEHIPEVFYQLGDEASFQTHSRAVASTPGKPDRILNDMSIVTSPLAKAIDPRVQCAPARAYGGDVTDFARWLQMPADMPGSQTLRSVGEKYERYEQMPLDWRNALAELDPEMAADPVAGMERSSTQYRN